MKRFLLAGLMTVSAGASAALSQPIQSDVAKDSVPVHGQVQLPVESMIDKLSAFEIVLNGKTYNTGPIKLMLDPSSGTKASLSLDFDKMQATLVTDLLVNAPLLKKLKAPPTTVSVTETGPFKFKELSHSKNTVEIALKMGNTTSSGTVGGGPFAGSIFRNKKKPCLDCCSYPANKARAYIKLDLDPTGNIVSGTAMRSPNVPPFCASDDGVLTFQDQHIDFSGVRTGNLAGK